MQEEKLYLYSIQVVVSTTSYARRSSLKVYEVLDQFEVKIPDSDMIHHISKPISYNLFNEKPKDLTINSEIIKADNLSTIVYVDLVSSQNYLENKKDLESKAIDIALEEYEKYYLAELKKLENIQLSVKKELNNLRG